MTKVSKEKPVVKEKTQKKFLNKKLSIALIILAVIFCAIILSFSWYSVVYADKIFPNISIGNTSFGGLTKDQASKIIIDKSNDLKDNKIKLSEGDHEWDLSANDLSLSYDASKTTDKLFSYARDGNLIANMKKRFALLFTPQNLNSTYEYDTQKLYSFLDNIFSSVETPVKDATFTYTDGALNIDSEQSGKQINRANLINQLDKSISVIDFSGNIDLTVNDVNPKITENDLTNLKSKVVAMLQSDIKLDSERKNITISGKEIFDWIDIVAISTVTQEKLSAKNKAYANDEVSYAPEIVVNQEKIKKFVSDISKDINQKPQDAKLSYLSGKVAVTQTPQKGYDLDQDATVSQITNLLSNRAKIEGVNTEDNQTQTSDTIKLSLKVTDPEISDTNIDSLGIKEQISSATTSFVGSTTSRIANVTKGASMFNGLVIKPGDTLSAIATIGNPSAETGYLPELVIKENKTLPEYGGGLCQVSTTLFRASLNAGLEILERTNHAYRVSYYEPPVGMDATIYYPNPDLVVKNNTPSYILIQTRVEGTNITFDFYGTKDARQVTVGEPKITETWNPPADQYVESKDLAVGEIKKLESSHPGAKTEFYYKVTLDGKTLTEQTFYSIYKAWQGSYLYGPGTQNIPGKENKDAGGNKCSNECEEGWTECKDGGIRRCNKDGDCLKWSATESCGDGKICSNNQCSS